MRKMVNGQVKQVYEIVIDLSCSGDKDSGERMAKIMEKLLKKRGIYDFDISFSNWRTEINLTDRKDLYNAIAILDYLMNEEEDSKINKFEITVSTY